MDARKEGGHLVVGSKRRSWVFGSRCWESVVGDGKKSVPSNEGKKWVLR